MTHGLRARRDLLELRHPPRETSASVAAINEASVPAWNPSGCPPAAGRLHALPRRSDNIDAIIAMCMALEAAENKPVEFELLGWL